MVILVAAVLSVLKSVNSHPQAGFAGDGAQGAFGRIPRLALPEPGDPTLARGPGQRKALVCRTQEPNWPHDRNSKTGNAFHPSASLWAKSDPETNGAASKNQWDMGRGFPTRGYSV